MTRTILRGGVTVLPERTVKDPLHIEGDRVADPGPDGFEIDLRDHLIFPGLVNAHDHLGINNVPPLPGHDLYPNSYAWAIALGPHFDDPAVAAALAFSESRRLWQGGLKNLLCGATTVAQHDPWHAVLDDQSFPVNLLRRFGWCHSLGLAPGRGHASGTIASWLDSGIDRLARHLPRSLRGHRLGPFGPSVVESFAATPPEQPWIIHLAEGTDAVAGGEFSQLVGLDCLAANTVLVHGVALTAADVGQLIDRGAAVVWCPASNLNLLGKTLNPRRLFDAGRLAIGTDSRLSGSRDLLDELRVAADHSDLAPVELFRLATSDGGRVLSMPEIGGLAAGQRADLLIARDSGGDPYEILLSLQRRDIRAVVRNGVPAIADIDFAGWFDVCGQKAVAATLDERPKLLKRSLARSEAIALEPGLKCVV